MKSIITSTSLSSSGNLHVHNLSTILSPSTSSLGVENALEDGEDDVGDFLLAPDDEDGELSAEALKSASNADGERDAMISVRPIQSNNQLGQFVFA